MLRGTTLGKNASGCLKANCPLDWQPENLRDDIWGWWQDTFRHHSQELDLRVKGYLDSSYQTATGCMELGTELYPARVQWRGYRQRVYQMVACWAAGECQSRERVVRHLCHNRACINPDHLTIGSQAENIHDQLQRRSQQVASYWTEG